MKQEILITIAALAAWLESIYNKTNNLIVSPRRNGDIAPCVLCGGVMYPDVRGGDNLVWYKCGRCRKSQVGGLPA